MNTAASEDGDTADGEMSGVEAVMGGFSVNTGDCAIDWVVG